MITHSKSDRAHTHTTQTANTLVHSFTLSLSLAAWSHFILHHCICCVFFAAADVVVVGISNDKRPLHTVHHAVCRIKVSLCLFTRWLLHIVHSFAFILCVCKYSNCQTEMHSGIVANREGDSHLWLKCPFFAHHLSSTCVCGCLLFKRLSELISLLKYIVLCDEHTPPAHSQLSLKPPVPCLFNGKKQRKKDHDACTNRVWHKGSFDFSKLKWIHTSAMHDMPMDE